jgi:transposase
MFGVTAATRIFVALEPVDLRQSFNGLFARVQAVLQEDPTSGHLYLFTNKQRNRLKILCYDGSGLWVYANASIAALSAGPKAREPAHCFAARN